MKTGDSTKTMFCTAHASLYEATFYDSRDKKWMTEVRDIVTRIADLRPGTSSLLDVACGVGIHLEGFRQYFDEVAGVELSEAMLSRARTRLPDIKIQRGDMRNFDFGRTFGAITCMYASINYLDGVDDLRATVANMARHLEPGGVVVIEPWWPPERFLNHYVGSDLVHYEDKVISRISHTTAEGRFAFREDCWVVGDPGKGLQTFTIVERFMMYERREYLAALDEAGFQAYFVEEWLGSSRLYVGVLRDTL